MAAPPAALHALNREGFDERRPRTERNLKKWRDLVDLPVHWPWAEQWLAIWTDVFGQAPGPPGTS